MTKEEIKKVRPGDTVCFRGQLWTVEAQGFYFTKGLPAFFSLKQQAHLPNCHTGRRAEPLARFCKRVAS